MQKNTSPEKAQYCEAALASIEQLKLAIQEIQAGENEGDVCQKYGIQKSAIRHFIFRNDTIFLKPELFSLREDPFFLFGPEEKLYHELVGGKTVPYDATNTIRLCIKNANLSHREIAILRMIFWENLTLEEAGNYFDVTRERVRQIKMRAIYKIRKYNRELLKFGSNAFHKKRIAQLEVLLEEKQALMERYQTMVEKCKQMDQSLTNYKENNHDKLQKAEETHLLTLADFLEDCKKKENISVRLYNCLYRANYLNSEWKLSRPLSDVQCVTKEEFMRSHRNLGNRSMEELVGLLSPYHLSFKEEEDDGLCTQ